MISSEASREALDAVSSSTLSGASLRRMAMQRLSELPGYDWCGVYRLEGDTLVLDEYVGAPTDHTQIAIGVGVCGTAVAEGRNLVVEDVSKLDNYLACSISTKSEIVVLILSESGEVLGQIDIDGHAHGAFDASDERFLSELARILASRWSTSAVE
jgi:GAF domain-containing protein